MSSSLKKKIAAPAPTAFQVHPDFKNKFKPSEANLKIKEIVENKLGKEEYKVE